MGVSLETVTPVIRPFVGGATVSRLATALTWCIQTVSYHSGGIWLNIPHRKTPVLFLFISTGNPLVRNKDRPILNTGRYRIAVIK